MPQMDIQSDFVAWNIDELEIEQTDPWQPWPAPAISLLGIQQGIATAMYVDPITPLGPTDDVRYYYETSVDSGTTWQIVPPHAILPVWNQQYHNKLYNASNGYLPTAGFIGAGRRDTAPTHGEMARIVFNVVSLAAKTTLVAIYFGQYDHLPYTGWTSAHKFPGDGKA